MYNFIFSFEKLNLVGRLVATMIFMVLEIPIESIYKYLIIIYIYSIGILLVWGGLYRASYV